VGRGRREAVGAAARRRVGASGFITPDQVADLETLCKDAGIPTEKLRERAAVERLAAIKTADYKRALDWINGVVKAREERQRAA
jgi:hypothetical protein